jgi:hypothetical protein
MATASRPRKTTAAAAARSPRERLLGRPRPSLPYPILVDDPGEARRNLERVERGARQVMLRHDEGTKAHKAARVQLEAAQQAVDDCYQRVILQAMPPADYEQLKADNPPTEAQLKAAKDASELPPDCDTTAFVPEVLAASTDMDMSAQDWAELLDRHMSDGERQELRVVVLGLNERARFAEPVVLPKGSTMTPSWRLS